MSPQRLKQGEDRHKGETPERSQPHRRERTVLLLCLDGLGSLFRALPVLPAPSFEQRPGTGSHDSAEIRRSRTYLRDRGMCGVFGSCWGRRVKPAERGGHLAWIAMEFGEREDEPERNREPPPPEDRVWRHPFEIGPTRHSARGQLWSEPGWAWKAVTSTGHCGGPQRRRRGDHRAGQRRQPRRGGRPGRRGRDRGCERRARDLDGHAGRLGAGSSPGRRPVT